MSLTRHFSSLRNAWYQLRRLKIEMRRPNATSKLVTSKRNLAILKKPSNSWTSSSNSVKKLETKPMPVKLTSNWPRPTPKTATWRQPSSTSKPSSASRMTNKTSNYKQMLSWNSVSFTTRKESLENPSTACRSTSSWPELTLRRARTRNWLTRQESTWVSHRRTLWLKITSTWYCRIWMDCWTGR